MEILEKLQDSNSHHIIDCILSHLKYQDFQNLIKLEDNKIAESCFCFLKRYAKNEIIWIDDEEFQRIWYESNNVEKQRSISGQSSSESSNENLMEVSTSSESDASSLISQPPVVSPLNQSNNPISPTKSKYTAYTESKIASLPKNCLLHETKFSKITESFSSIYRRLVADGDILWLDDKYLQDRSDDYSLLSGDENIFLNNNNYGQNNFPKIQTVHLNYVWWLDIKVKFILNKNMILANFPITKHLLRFEDDYYTDSKNRNFNFKFRLKCRWYLKFQKQPRQNNSYFYDETYHCSHKLELGMTAINTNNFKVINKKFKNVSDLYYKLAHEYINNPPYSSFYNNWVFFEDPDFYIDLPISQINDLEVTCFFRDLDTKVLKSNIDFGFVDLYIEEAA